VIGFRDEAIVRHLRPNLTRYQLSLHDVGEALGNTLLEQINSQDGSSGPVAQMKIPMTLLPGDSDPPLADIPRAGRKSRRARSPGLPAE
jgi:DNA-binding LacI/PurR family transcriptional regulator